jgi:hypothetical protein
MTENALVEHKIKRSNTRFLKDLEFLERQHNPDTNFSKMISEIKKFRKKY